MNTPASTLPAPPQDERLIAAFSHAAILLPGMGMVIPLMVWITQKDKSRFLAFQALQALAYQFSILLAWFGGMACYMLSFFAAGLIVALVESAGHASSAVEGLFFLPFLVMTAFMLGELAILIYGLAAAVLVLRGRDFRYLILGKRLERYLERG